jgi:GGDEF domain-containing protein
VARICGAIRGLYEWLGNQISADASVGRSLQATAPVWAMIQHTDLAMYNTKDAGRRTHRFFEPVTDARKSTSRIGAGSAPDTDGGW